MRLWALVLVMASAVLPLACGEQERPTPIPTAEVVHQIPWGEREEAIYRALRGDSVVGRGVISLQREGRVLIISQDFTDARGRFRDVVKASVDAVTLRPQVVERVLTGPEGERRWRAQYEDGRVRVFQESDGDTRTDELVVPPVSYDSWSDIALWRTMPLAYGFRATYMGVGTAILRKPATAVITVEVVSKETVIVPAGTFQAWRVQVLSGDEVQTVWMADLPQRPVVRYDNGTYVFELEELR